MMMILENRFVDYLIDRTYEDYSISNDIFNKENEENSQLFEKNEKNQRQQHG